MRHIAVRFTATVASIYLLSLIIRSIEVDASLSLIWFGLIFIGVGLIMRPIMMAVGLPVSILTAGLFLLVINAWLLMLTDWMTPNIQIGGFLNALLISQVVAIVKELFRAKERPDSHRVLKEKSVI